MSVRYTELDDVLRLFPDAWSGAHRAELAGALASLPADQVEALDDELRALSEWHAAPSLDDPSLQLAASCHASGHVRERAVRRLATRQDGRELPFLLVRLNDWVPQVRAVASDALARRIALTRVDAWVGVLPAVCALRDKGRADHTALCYAVENLIVGADGDGAWRHASTAQPRAVRRALVALACRHPRSLPPRRLSLLSDDDPVVALGVARAIVTRTPDAVDALTAGWAAPHAAVRRVVFARLVHHTPDADALIAAAAIAADRGLRALARHEWRRRGVEARARYRSALAQATGPERFALLRALADVAEKDDAPLLRPLLADASVRARLLAVTVLARWEALSLAPMLDDPSPKVVWAAGRALRPEARLLDVEWLRARIASAPRPTALAALRIAMGLSPWRALAIAARAAVHDDDVIAERAARLFARGAWCLFVAPRADEATDVRAALAAGRSRLEPRSVAAVEDSLRVFRAP